MKTQPPQTDLLLQAGRLLLEYNESTGAVYRALAETAKALTNETCHIVISYNHVAVALAGDGYALQPVSELRYNSAVQARVHEILDQVRQGRLDVSAALASLSTVEVETPRHSPWLTSIFLGAGAASLAGLLGADPGAAGVAGLATGLGLLARWELGRHQCNLFALPVAAAFLGAVIGGLAIRMNWTQTPELVLVVPAIMLIPGPHLINALFDLISNHLPMCISRLGLAIGILLASTVGLVLGVELTLNRVVFPDQSASAEQLTFVFDVVLSGIVASGFGMFYNTAWRHLWMAALGGVAGHGVRFIALELGCWLGAATFVGGLAVGAISAWMARSSRTPVAVIAFAGAVTMIPGLSLYRAFGGALQLARLQAVSDSTAVAGILGNALQACLVISGLGMGLILAARAVIALIGE
jgi:uncharacterized membrane protein YjjP (DUF1212 family)